MGAEGATALAESFTIGALATAGIGWAWATIPSGIAGGWLGNAGDRGVCGVVDALLVRMRGLRTAEENSVAAKAVRLAQMQALEHTIREFRAATWPKGVPDAKRGFYDDSLDFCAVAVGRCLNPRIKLNLAVTEPLEAAISGLLDAPVPGGPTAQRLAAIGSFAEDQVLEELAAAVGGHAVFPAGFEARFRQGDGAEGKRFLAHFTERLRDRIAAEPAFHAILTSGTLARIEGLAFDTAEMLHRLVGETLPRVERKIDSMAAELRAIRTDLAREAGVDPELLRPIFEHLGHLNLSATEIRARAKEAVAAILERAQQPPAPTNDGADIAATLGAARDKLGRLDTAGALATLSGKLAEEEAARRQRMVPLLAEKAAIERLTYDHAAAKATLRQLLDLAPDEMWRWIELGDSHVTTGDLAGALAAFREALAAAQRAEPGGRDEGVALNRIGDVQVAQGDLAAAPVSFRAANAIAERLATADPTNAGCQRDLSVSHNKIGEVRVAQGDLAAALASFRGALAIRERLGAADPAHAGRQRDLSVSHERIGDVQVAQGDLAAALASFRASLAIRERLAAADPAHAGWQRDLSVSHGKIGDVQVAQGDLPAALASFRAGFAIAERLAAADPANAEWQRNLSVSHEKIGDVQMAQGDLAAALASFRAALAIRERLAAADRANAGWQRDLSVSHTKIGDVQVARGDLAAALAGFRAAQAIRERLAAADPANAEWQRDLAMGHERIGDFLARQDNVAAALDSFGRALALYDAALRRNPDDIQARLASVVPLLRIGALRGAAGRAELRAALAILRPLAAADRLDHLRRGWIPQIEAALARLGA